MMSANKTTSKNGGISRVLEKEEKEFPIVRFESKVFNNNQLDDEFHSVFLLHLTLQFNKQLTPSQKEELCARQRDSMKSFLDKLLNTKS